MKLHRMEITAFGPFAGREVVDFDALNEAGVFLLNGETGSGKTSVLDAICFALYGSGPTTTARGGRKAQHSDHADPHTGPRVEVEFTAGGRRWWVRRTPAWREPSTRAASGWSERHASVLLTEFVDGQWVERGYRPDDVGQLVHHAIGLDREQFTQVMMLPQGQFARFLQAGSKEREQLLETLFGMDVYAEVQEELKRRADQARGQLREAEAEAARTEDLRDRLRDRLDQATARLPPGAREEIQGAGSSSTEESAASESTRTVPPAGEEGHPQHAAHEPRSSDTGHDPGQLWDDLAAASAAVVDAVGHSRQRAAADHDQARKHVADLEKRHEIAARLEHLTRQRDRLLRSADRAGTVAQRLQLHDAASDLHDSIAMAREAEGRVREAEERVGQLRRELAPGTASGSAARQVLGEQSAVLENQLRTEAFSPALRDAVVAARETARTADRRSHDLQRDQAEAHQERQRLDELTAQEQQVAEQLRRARAEATEQEQEHEALQAGTRDEALIRERARAAREAVEASRTYAHARSVAEERARDYERDEAARREAARQVEELETQRYANAAASLAGDLQPGEPCPVCGSLTHPGPARPTGVEEVTPDALERARSARGAAQQAADASHEAWQRAQQAATEVLAGGAEADLVAVVERARLAGDEEEELLSRLERVRDSARALATAREAVTTLESQAAGAASEVAASRARAADLTRRCEREEHELTAQLRGFDSAALFLEQAESLLATVDGWATAHHALENARADARSCEQAMRRALSASPFGGAEEVARALVEPREAEELRAWLDEHRRELAAVDAELSTRDMRDAARLTPEEVAGASEEHLERAAARRDELESLRDQLTQQLGGLRTLHEDIVGAARGVPEQVASHAEVRRRAEMLTGLSDVATANSSENSLRMTLTSFVLAAKLEQVAAVASEHLARMSSGRFTLVHTDRARGSGKSGLGLEIDDAWTGNRRGTETLSGGESFFTSLALALALADVVRAEAGGRDIDTLFVDEGFGSLDEQTLEQVLETLDGLRRDGRVIGVVSHVSEMKQRIGTQLVVTKTPQGSHLEVTTDSWGPA